MQQEKIIRVLGLKIVVKKAKSIKDIQKNYNLVLKRLKKKFKKKQKIRVAFLSNEISKWCYDSLYKKLEKSPFFEPIILTFPRYELNDELKNLNLSFNDGVDFYQKKGYRVFSLYENNTYKRLQTFKPDIIFYQQKFGLKSSYKPNRVSKYALTMFSSYGFEIENLEVNYSSEFHKLLFRYFVEHEENKKRYIRYNSANSWNIEVTGYPKLDTYLEIPTQDLDKYWKDKNKFKIIYAPHHSFANNNGYNIGTFLDNGKFILELAKNTPQTTWCFKPHPRLAIELLERQIMTEDEINKYYSEWESIGTICQEGSYIDLFKSSDLMITDSSSFLAEYLASKKPLIRLMKKSRQKLNPLGELVVSEYYNSYNNKELEGLFNEIVIKRNDYKKEKREKLISEIIDFKQSAANKIYNYLINLLGGTE